MHVYNKIVKDWNNITFINEHYCKHIFLILNAKKLLNTKDYLQKLLQQRQDIFMHTAKRLKLENKTISLQLHQFIRKVAIKLYLLHLK